jgi:hypothetical protein
MMFAYSRGQRPPALLATLGVSDLRGDNEFAVEAKLDTGAAMSAIPSSILERLKPSVAGTVQARGPFDQHSRRRPTYFVRLRFPWAAGETRTSLVVATESAYGLIGRDILNGVVLHADGPQETFTVT